MRNQFNTPEQKAAWQKFQRQQRDLRKHRNAVVPLERVKHWLLVAAQEPGALQVTDDGEFSSAFLTQRYVEDYCVTNHLKH